MAQTTLMFKLKLYTSEMAAYKRGCLHKKRKLFLNMTKTWIQVEEFATKALIYFNLNHIHYVSKLQIIF